MTVCYYSSKNNKENHTRKQMLENVNVKPLARPICLTNRNIHGYVNTKLKMFGNLNN